MALSRSFSVGYRIGEAFNPFIQPYLARALEAVLGDPFANSQQNGDVSAKECKMLSKGEIEKLKAGGEDPHDHKPKKNGSNFDLYKTHNGDIYVFRKGGVGAGTPTGLNINKF